MRGPNEYNTTDPSTLLRLKRQEARAMLELVRSVHPTLSREEIIHKVVNTIRDLLGVNKLMLVSRVGEEKKVDVNYGFPAPVQERLEELNAYKEITQITSTD